MRDASFYVVFCHDQKVGAYMPERQQCDMGYASTVDAIIAGEWQGVSSIVEFNPFENSSRDCTEDVALVVGQRWAETDEALEPWQVEFLETAISVSFANEFRRAA